MNRFSFSQRLLIIAILVLLASCRDKEIIPTASFSYTLADPGLSNYLAVYPVGYSIQTTNTSTDASAYLWDFGNGSTSTEQAPRFSYLKSGEYTIKLTTTSTTGAQQISTKSIKVVDQVLKRITIKRLNWNAFDTEPTWSADKRADLLFEIGQRTGQGPPTVSDVILYRPEPVRNVSSTTVPFEIPVTQRVVLNPSMINLNLLINVYGNDGGGNQLVYSSGGAGIGFSSYFDTATNYYTINTGALGTSITLECGYE